MWRAFFLAIGVYLCILGVECLAVERVVLKVHDRSAAAGSLVDAASSQSQPKVVIPPPWAPWSLMATGTVVMLYSFTIPRRVSGN
jgi:hypothetical protein